MTDTFLREALDAADTVSDRLGIGRREFLRLCAATAATLGLPAGAEAAIAKAVEKAKRPPVIWLHFQECTGCSESLLRAEHPTLEKLILDVISLDYHETLMAAAGHQAEAARKASMQANKGKYILVVEGAIPVRDGGIYCKVGGRKAIDLVRECAADAAAVIAIGSCASWGGMPSTDPNPTGSSSVGEVLGKAVVTIPGCPPNPYNFLATAVHFLTFGKLPEVDALGRPKFAYGRLVHENCERRAHFDAGRFAMEFGDTGHRQGYCLYKLGCKGPETYANCPTIGFGDVGEGNWPVGCGHPCIGCTEKGVAFTKPIHQVAVMKNVVPPLSFPRIVEDQGKTSFASAAALAAIAGAAAGAAAMLARNLGKSEAGRQDAQPPKGE
ncbi:MAG TPA: hydrogenase 2 small subunit [Rhodocyclaceae bacterium]|nr:MAG: hydrogenase 2 small subunit [Betaproteobacteria bacterium CG2_30_68_42]PJA56593.1 MAG: hydrogenase 2 small subunit [Rhodocyclales bacterium CG_4_9_14_3_um_filter_68_10]HCX32384.1 hydrogenase 2 small subunit [Rhodocyclaceae bacterium]